MSDIFYKNEKLTITHEKIFTSSFFIKALLHCFFLFFIIILLIILYSINARTTHFLQTTFIFDIYVISIMLYFFIKLPRTKIVSILILIIFLTTITYEIVDNKLDTLHLVTIWLFAPFLLIYIANDYLIDIPYKIFIKMQIQTFNNFDLFTSTKEQTKHHKKDKIYIDIFPQTDKQDTNFLKIQDMYIRLIKFWYSQKNYLFKLRYFFPLLASIGGIFYFFYLLDFIQNDIKRIDSIDKMVLMTISLTLFYFTMTHHINSFLHSKFYMNSILEAVGDSKIHFENHEYRHQIKLFFDKNFLVYIHDKNYDKHFCVNDSIDFQNFISEEKFDEEGRNLIIMVYISFFMILFIETATSLLISDKN